MRRTIRDRLKILQNRYHTLSLARKFSLMSGMIIVASMLVFTFVVRFFFEQTVLNITSESYRQKFDAASDSSQELLNDAEKIAKILLTDPSLQNWFLKGTEDAGIRLQQKISVEERLDYLDALYPDNQYSSISVFDKQGEMVNSNSIRAEASVYKQFYKVIARQKESPCWLDLYQLEIAGYQGTGIAYLRAFRNYASGKICGYIMIEYRSSLLSGNFTHMKYGETGHYLIADLDGNVKIEDDQDSEKNILDEEFFQWVKTEPQGGSVFSLQGQRCLITAETIPKLNWVMIGVIPVSELTQKGQTMIDILYGVGLLAVLLSFCSSCLLAHSVTRPLTLLAKTMERFGKGDLSVYAPVQYRDETGMLAEKFNKMAEQIRLLVDQVYKEQKEKRKSELAALQAQINPHFLYNTLNSVSSLIKMNHAEEAFTMIHAIGMFYRTSLSDGKTLIPIEQEITNIENYMQIQKMRYGTKIDYEIEISPDILQQWIVKLTLQPLVENAIYHGVKAIRQKGLIRVCGRKTQDCILLQVSDNGAGMEAAQLEHLLEGGRTDGGHSFGLYNVQQRIRLYFGTDYGLKIASTPGQGTCVTVRLPLNFDGSPRISDQKEK